MRSLRIVLLVLAAFLAGLAAAALGLALVGSGNGRPGKSGRIGTLFGRRSGEVALCVQKALKE